MNDTTKQYLYTCSANSIQGYVFGDERLREIVGASLLIEELPDVVSGAAGKLFKQDAFTPINTAAGMVGILFDSEENARKLASLAPLILHRHAPELPFTQAVVPVDDGKLGAALDKANKAMRNARNQPPITLPETTGILERAARSGLAASAKNKNEAFAPRTLAKETRFGGDGGTLGLLRKILPAEELSRSDKELQKRWPQNFEDFTKNEGEYLAVVHADVNGLGDCVKSFLSSLDDKSSLHEAIEHYQTFSGGLTDCGIQALKSSLDKLLEGFPTDQAVPFRPLVAAGDDVTYVIHAAHAFDFTRNVLEKLSEEAGKLFTKLGIDNSFSAAAGIAFVKPHYPFSRAYQLAEELCAYTKNKTERDYSALSFHRLTTSLIESYGEFIKTGMTNANGLCLTMNPYALNPDENGKPSIEELQDLARSASKLPRGALRGFVGRLQASPDLALRDWERLFEVQNKKAKVALKHFAKALHPFVPNDNAIEPTPLYAHANRTPLFDALEWSGIHGEHKTKDELSP